MTRDGVEDAQPVVRTQTEGDDGSDAELIARAQQGEVGAFAILVHRHAATLCARAGDMDAVEQAFQRAMRRLHTADTADVEAWLLRQLPRAHRPTDGDTRSADPEAVPAAPLATHELDALWAALAPRWPRGRKPLRVPRWVGRLTLVLVLLALAVAIPYVLLTTADGDEPAPDPLAEVEGVPLDDDAFDLTFEDEEAADEAAGEGDDEADQDADEAAGEGDDEADQDADEAADGAPTAP